jgi:hypothetical protein
VNTVVGSALGSMAGAGLIFHSWEAVLILGSASALGAAVGMALWSPWERRHNRTEERDEGCIT